MRIEQNVDHCAKQGCVLDLWFDSDGLARQVEWQGCLGCPLGRSSGDSDSNHTATDMSSETAAARERPTQSESVRVLIIISARASGAASQADVTLRFGNLYSFREGQISALDSYYAVDEALKAVGLEE